MGLEEARERRRWERGERGESGKAWRTRLRYHVTMWWAEWRRGCGAAGCEWQMADGSCSMRCMTHPEHGGEC